MSKLMGRAFVSAVKEEEEEEEEGKNYGEESDGELVLEKVSRKGAAGGMGGLFGTALSAISGLFTGSSSQPARRDSSSSSSSSSSDSDGSDFEVEVNPPPSQRKSSRTHRQTPRKRRAPAAPIRQSKRVALGRSLS